MSLDYLDMEMTEDDLAERLTDMGYDTTDDQDLQKNLHYYLLQDFKPFDKPAGGSQLMSVVERDKAEVVVIDTLARVVDGDENEADTFRDFDTNTGKPLKAAGVTVVRLDHMGKDAGKGPRGSSAKRDDVDVSWIISVAKKDPSSIKFTLDKGRQGWIPKQFDVDRIPGPPLQHKLKQMKLTDRASRLVAKLDELDVSTNIGRPAVKKILDEEGVRASSGDLAAAIAARKRRSGQVADESSWTTIGQGSRTGDSDDA